MDKEKITVKIMSEIIELIPGYLENRKKDILFIEEALKSSDWKQIQNKGHDMKGSGKGYGFDTISDIGKEIEEGAKAKNPQLIQTQINRLQDYLNRVEYQEE